MRGFVITFAILLGVEIVYRLSRLGFTEYPRVISVGRETDAVMTLMYGATLWWALAVLDS